MQTKHDAQQSKPKSKAALLQELEIRVWCMTMDKLTTRVPIDDFRGMREHARNYEQVIIDTVNECMALCCRESKYDLITAEKRQNIVDNTIFDIARSEPLLAKAEGYHAVSSNGFLYAHSDSLQARGPNTGYKFHVSVDESPLNMQRAWSACFHAAKRAGIDSFKMVEEPTVDDKKGRQVTIYLHVPAGRVAQLAQRLPDIIQDFSCAVVRSLVIPDARGMPDDCAAVPGSRHVSFRCDYFPFLHPKQAYDPIIGSSGDTYLSQDHLDCAKYVVNEVGVISSPEQDQQAIERFMSNISDLNDLNESQKSMFISDVKSVLKDARLQAQHNSGVIQWYNLNPREEEKAIGKALNGCQVSAAAMMRAECQGWRHYGENVDLTVVHEPLTRETLSTEEEAERAAIAAEFAQMMKK